MVVRYVDLMESSIAQVNSMIRGTVLSISITN
jgi:hypothetical protein